jgi:hypothetical protein
VLVNQDSKNIIVDNKQILKEYSSNFAPLGQYSFPFSFKLPFWLPPSFVFSENGQLEFAIYYAVEALLCESQIYQ